MKYFGIERFKASDRVYTFILRNVNSVKLERGKNGSRIF